MKTILYNPIFINPQAYYVFPRLTRYLQPDNKSTAEPANYIGTIEVKVIAYGDTTLKRTYTNTDSIDLSEFKNTWIRISLFTKVGSCVLGEWKIGNMESDLPYIDPEVLASLKAVVIVGNKTNNDSDRAIVKNLVDPDNPFVISNAAYTEGSGYADKDSPYYGAFVTDGIDDLITSTKTVQEMLGGSNELTIVSMIHQVKDSANNVSFTNYIRGSANGYFRNIANNYGKTGIYGYTSSDLMALSVVNNILGDKNDYTSNGDNRDSIINGNFSVQGYSYNDGNNTGDFSSVAWYWTIIANKVLTTDQINQVIAYFNLDRTLKPDILPKDAYLRANLYLNNNVDEPAEFTFNGVSIGYSRSITVDTAFNIGHIYNYDSPQEVNITIDEYIRYEDIVQPYPVLLRFNDENGNEVSWGGKFRVGSTITRIGSAADSNLLPNIYNIFGLLLNDNQVTSSKVIVEKTMVFKAKSAYIFDNNEPKCILSPSRLRMPNSSYKILGHIPDISGHGNHGVIHNSAYAKGSGVNEDGSYQFDGVDDFVTIPTVTGGKQVLMKVNWQSIAGTAILYDQRTNGGFAIFNRDYDTNENKVPAYRARNIGGNTYIDGILNEYIYASQLQNITHNIVELYDPELNIGTLNPKIGSSYLNSNYAQMSLYDFMLFDNISTDDKIKELNEYVGIEAKVELPPYYWDAYGKTNLDEDKATIQQRGVAVGDYDLTNHNHAYEGMSGYNGYPVVFGANKTWENFSSVYSYTSDVTSTTIHITRVKNAGTGLLFSYVKKDGALTNIREIPAFRVTVKGLEGNSKFGYRYLATEDATVETLVYLGNGTHELSKSFTPTEALLDLTRNAWVGIFITPMVEGEVVFDCDITIEVLPEYENGLVYDGVDDYSKNENIPVLTDYTIIAKRLWINKDNPLNEQFIHKGAINTPISESAFMLEYEIANDTYYRSSSYGGYINIERSNRPERIVYQTSNSYNGTSITKGSGTDTTGIVIGGVTNNYWNGVFYKLMLYSKTLPLLQINYLKNLMEKDEIIDLNNKIFIQE